jgi:hypothetical protein
LARVDAAEGGRVWTPTIDAKPGPGTVRRRRPGTRRSQGRGA